jgi:gas vesicle protein
MRNKNMLTFLIGAAIGSLSVWLFTSKKGKKLRAEMKENFNQIVDKFKGNASNPSNS